MKQHAEPDDDWFALLVELAAGALGAREARAVERHAEQCAGCRNALGWIRPTLDALAAATPAVAPPPQVFERVAARIAAGAAPAAQPWQDWRPEVGAESVLVRDAARSAWRATAHPGVEVRELASDPDAEAVTMLIRMAPGATYPAHEHAGPEECFVLEGDLALGPVRMRAGDFQRMEAGTRHPRQTTTGGCVLFLRSSTRDRLLGSG